QASERAESFPSADSEVLRAAPPSLEQPLPLSNAAARIYAGDHSIVTKSLTLSLRNLEFKQGINTVNCRGLELLRHPVEQTRSKVGNKYFILGRTSHLAMEAKFFRFLKLVGVGFKARTEREGRELFLKLGYSHEVQFTAPPAVRVFCFKPNIICCTGIDKHRVHHFAGAVRCSKPPEVYKGKGILYIDEVIKLKPGKKQQKK
uniref:Large ribosomal subunit protein uL6 alpha-beta domain-containing protein n=5 Tax=Triticinae TaxID=1648030 RepID=A0A453PJF7_AEGTS